MLLAFDTATPHVSVALHDGEDVVAELTAERPMKHGEQLAPLIDGFEARGRAELHDDYASPLPVTAFTRLLGLPLDQHESSLHRDYRGRPPRTFFNHSSPSEYSCFHPASAFSSSRRNVDSPLLRSATITSPASN